MILQSILMCAALAATPLDAGRAPSSALPPPLVADTMLVCDGGNLQSCQMRCTVKFKQCHRGDPGRIQQCRTDVLEPCNQACDEDCG
jgi:hypothetical protein